MDLTSTQSGDNTHQPELNKTTENNNNNIDQTSELPGPHTNPAHQLHNINHSEPALNPQNLASQGQQNHYHQTINPSIQYQVGDPILQINSQITQQQNQQLQQISNHGTENNPLHYQTSIDQNYALSNLHAGFHGDPSAQLWSAQVDQNAIQSNSVKLEQQNPLYGITYDVNGMQTGGLQHVGGIQNVLQNTGVHNGSQNGIPNGIQNVGTIGAQNLLHNGIHSDIQHGVQNGLSSDVQNVIQNGLPNGLQNGIQNGIHNSLQNGLQNSLHNGLQNCLQPSNNVYEQAYLQEQANNPQWLQNPTNAIIQTPITTSNSTTAIDPTQTLPSKLQNFTNPSSSNLIDSSMISNTNLPHSLSNTTELPLTAEEEKAIQEEIADQEAAHTESEEETTEGAAAGSKKRGKGKKIRKPRTIYSSYQLQCVRSIILV